MKGWLKSTVNDNMVNVAPSDKKGPRMTTTKVCLTHYITSMTYRWPLSQRKATNFYTTANVKNKNREKATLMKSLRRGRKNKSWKVCSYIATAQQVLQIYITPPVSLYYLRMWCYSQISSVARFVFLNKKDTKPSCVTQAAFDWDEKDEFVFREKI